MGTVLTMSIAVDGKSLVAVWAFQLPYNPVLNLVPVAVPPGHPAGIGAEFLLLSSAILLNDLTALQTMLSLFRFLFGQWMTSAIGLDRVLRQAYLFGDFPISGTFVPEFSNLCFLLIVHI